MVTEYKSEVHKKLDDALITAPGVSKNDIPHDVASRAHYGTSWEPEDRGYRQQLDYVNHMNAVYADLSKKAKTPEQQALLKDEFERYRQGYIKHQLSYLGAHSRVVSSFIAGPSNFPTRTMEKRNDTVQNRLNEWIEYDKKAQTAIGKKLNPTMYAISSDRSDAVDLLKKELESKKKTHEIMIEANKIIRKTYANPEDKIAELKKIGLSEANAREILKPGVYGGSGYYTFQLTNSNANIKRIENRIKELEIRRSQETQKFKFDGGTVIDNVEENRIQINYDDKPSPEIITKLKSRGFHWSPYNKVWQRMRSNGANYAVKEIVGKISKIEKQEEKEEPNVISTPVSEYKETSNSKEPTITYLEGDKYYKGPGTETVIKVEREKQTPKEPWQMTVKEYQTKGKPNFGDLVTDGEVAGTLRGSGGMGSGRVIIEDNLTKVKHYANIDDVKLIRRLGVGSAINDFNYDSFHKNIVKQALSEGKLVPTEVLKDYPDLELESTAKAMGLSDSQIAQAKNEGVTTALGLRRIEKNSRNSEPKQNSQKPAKPLEMKILTPEDKEYFKAKSNLSNQLREQGEKRDVEESLSKGETAEEMADILGIPINRVNAIISELKKGKPITPKPKIFVIEHKGKYKDDRKPIGFAVRTFKANIDDDAELEIVHQTYPIMGKSKSKIGISKPPKPKAIRPHRKPRHPYNGVIRHKR